MCCPNSFERRNCDEARADQDRHDERDERGDEDAGHCAATPLSASATISSPTEREPFTSTTSPGPDELAGELRRCRPRRRPTRPARSRARARRRRRRGRSPLACRPPRGSAAASSPSSAISPRIATVRRPAARSRRYASAACIATGFAFQASLIEEPAARQLALLRAPARERHVDDPVRQRHAERLAHRERRRRIRSLVARREREDDLAAAEAHVREAVAHLHVRRRRTAGSRRPPARTARARARPPARPRRRRGGSASSSSAFARAIVLDAAEQLEVHGRDRGDDADVGPRDLGERRGSAPARASPSPSRRPRCRARCGRASAAGRSRC